MSSQTAQVQHPKGQFHLHLTAVLLLLTITNINGSITSPEQFLSPSNQASVCNYLPALGEGSSEELGNQLPNKPD